MSLIVEPDDGIGPVVSAIQKAKTSIDIGIFRLDRGDIAKALRTAAGRGVQVRTLIAHTHRGGDKRLAAFLRGARKQLLVYDPKLTDLAMIRILKERVSAGVSVRILGKLGKRGAGLTAEKFPGKRLHVRAIVRDGQQAFVGSQGLRKLELDGRREVGVIVKERKVVARMAAVFEEDWAETDRARQDVKDAKKDEKAEAAAKVEAKEAKAEASAAA